MPSNRFSRLFSFVAAIVVCFPTGAVVAQPSAVPASIGLAITKVTIRTPKFIIGGSFPVPLVEVGFSGAKSGLRDLIFTLTSPSGLQHYDGLYQTGLTNTSGYVLVGNDQTPLSRWAEPGLWTITSMGANDWAGDGITLTPAQIAALTQGQGVTVVNRNTPDTAPPVIASAKIITPLVTQAAPYVRVSMVVSDNLSGMNTVWINFEGPPGSYTGFGNSFLSPQLSQTASLASNLIGPGSYTITLLGACDNAGNCVQHTSPADISRLMDGKVSFTVSQ